MVGKIPDRFTNIHGVGAIDRHINPNTFLILTHPFGLLPCAGVGVDIVAAMVHREIAALVKIHARHTDFLSYAGLFLLIQVLAV